MEKIPAEGSAAIFVVYLGAKFRQEQATGAIFEIRHSACCFKRQEDKD